MLRISRVTPGGPGFALRCTLDERFRMMTPQTETLYQVPMKMKEQHRRNMFVFRWFSEISFILPPLVASAR